MKKLSTESQADDFRSDLRAFIYSLSNLTRDLPMRYRNYETTNRTNFIGDPSRRPSPPDSDSLYTGFSMMLVPLHYLVESISQLEDILCEYDEGTEDHSHTLGELFATKTAYLEIVKSLPHLEDSRVSAYQRSMSARDFFLLVDSTEGVPSEADMDNQLNKLFNANKFYSNTLSTTTTFDLSGINYKDYFLVGTKI